MDPPDSMPNSEVKRCNADGSVGIPHVRVGHRQVRNKREPQREIVEVFLYWGNEETQTIIPYHNEQCQASIKNKENKEHKENKTEQKRKSAVIFYRFYLKINEKITALLFFSFAHINILFA